MDSPLTILVVDDEPNIRRTLSLHLESRGHHVDSAKSLSEGIKKVEQNRFDIAFVDLRLGQQTGLDLLSYVQRLEVHPAVIVITAYASLESAIEAMKRGARDYLPKPFKPAQIDLSIKRIREMDLLERQVTALTEDVAQRDVGIEWRTSSRTMKSVLDFVRKVAASEMTVLIRGETGTGKGVIAREIHRLSPRSGRPFVVVSCPAIPSELLESELFGYVKGAFTGAGQTRGGKVALAEGGTLFLDEAGDLPQNLQAKLLRFAQDFEYERVGDPHTLRANVRILAATNRDLEEQVAAGKFREDLYFRLNALTVTVPSLRERVEDILPLANHFLQYFKVRYSREGLHFSREAERALVDHPWKGNIRELRNAVERAVMLAEDVSLGPAELGLAPGVRREIRVGGNMTLEEVEREHIERVVGRTRSFREAAGILGIDETTLWRRRQKYGEEEK